MATKWKTHNGNHVEGTVACTKSRLPCFVLAAGLTTRLWYPSYSHCIALKMCQIVPVYFTERLFHHAQQGKCWWPQNTERQETENQQKMSFEKEKQTNLSSCKTICKFLSTVHQLWLDIQVDLVVKHASCVLCSSAYSGFQMFIYFVKCTVSKFVTSASAVDGVCYL